MFGDDVEVQETTEEPEAQQTTEPGAPSSELEKLKSELREARREAGKYRTQLRGIEADKQKAQEATLAEQNRHKELAELRERERDQAKAELAAERLERMRLLVATEKGLPARLASRLVGSTLEELTADADEMLKLLPSRQEPTPTPKPRAPDINADSVPPAKAPTAPAAKLTVEQLKAAERAGMTPEEYAKYLS